MNKKAVGVVVLVALIAVAGGLYWLSQEPEPEPESRVAVLPPPRPLPAPTPAVAPEKPAEPAIIHPLEPEPTPEPMPEQIPGQLSLDQILTHTRAEVNQ